MNENIHNIKVYYYYLFYILQLQQTKQQVLIKKNMRNQLINASQLSNKGLTKVNSFENVYSAQKTTKIPIFALILLSFNKQILLISGDDIGRLMVFKFKDLFVKIKEINAHSHRIRSIVVVNSKKGFIASASQGSLTTIRVWNIFTGTALATLKGHTQTISSLIQLNNGGFIGSASYDGTIKIWDWNNQNLQNDISAHGFPILSLIKSNQNEKIIISGADDYSIKIWDYQNEQCLFTLSAHQGYVQSLVWLGNDEFASGAADGEIYFWNMKNIQKKKTQPQKIIKIHKQTVTGLSYLSNNKLLISISEDMSLIVWDVQNMKLFAKKQSGHNNTISGLAVSQDINTIFTAGWDGIIHQYTLQL